MTSASYRRSSHLIRFVLRMQEHLVVLRVCIHLTYALYRSPCKLLAGSHEARPCATRMLLSTYWAFSAGGYPSALGFLPRAPLDLRLQSQPVLVLDILHMLPVPLRLLHRLLHQNHDPSTVVLP